MQEFVKLSAGQMRFLLNIVTIYVSRCVCVILVNISVTVRWQGYFHFCVYTNSASKNWQQIEVQCPYKHMSEGPSFYLNTLVVKIYYSICSKCCRILKVNWKDKQWFSIFWINQRPMFSFGELSESKTPCTLLKWCLYRSLSWCTLHATEWDIDMLRPRDVWRYLDRSNSLWNMFLTV